MTNYNGVYNVKEDTRFFIRTAAVTLQSRVARGAS